MRPTASTVLVLILVLLLFPLDQRLAILHELIIFVRGEAPHVHPEGDVGPTDFQAGIFRSPSQK